MSARHNINSDKIENYALERDNMPKRGDVKNGPKMKMSATQRQMKMRTSTIILFSAVQM